MKKCETPDYHLSASYTGKKGRMSSAGASMLARSLNSISRLISPTKVPAKLTLPKCSLNMGGRQAAVEFFKTAKLPKKPPAHKAKLRSFAAPARAATPPRTSPTPSLLLSGRESPSAKNYHSPLVFDGAQHASLERWEALVREFIARNERGEEIYAFSQRYIEFVQEEDLAFLSDAFAHARTATHLRLACFYERFLFLLAFNLELAQRLPRDAVFFGKAARICLDSHHAARDPSKSPLACLTQNNARLARFLHLQAADEPELRASLDKVHELAPELTLAEATAHLLAAFKDRFRRWGVVEEADSQEYNLVLDLDETLVHCADEGGLALRPHLHDFLSAARTHFKLFIFTSSLPEYADAILDHLEGGAKLFSGRFYRHHTSLVGEQRVKDLRHVGFDPAVTIIVDNTPENFEPQRENGIFVPPFFDDAADTALPALLAVLRKLVAAQPSDVREFLARYRADLIESIRRGAVVPTAR